MARAGGFPPDFVWGCSNSSYQTEGSTRADGRGESIWDDFCRKPGAVALGHSGERACDSYLRPEEDIALLKGLGLGAYRLSVAWPRIQPEGSGRPLEAGLAYYSRLVDGLLEAGIEPWITAYHWDLPLELERQGGWPARDTAYRFAEYAQILFRSLGDRVRSWVTLNEPWCSAFLGYSRGEHAPGQRDEALAYRATHHLLLGHGLAVEAFRATCPEGRIGLVINPAKPRPARARPEDEAASLRASVERTGLWLDPVFGKAYPAEHLRLRGASLPLEAGDLKIISQDLDFIGVNYYNEDVVEDHAVDPDHPEGFAYAESWEEKTEMGWRIVPQGLRRILGFIAKTWSPKALYVTENGAAFPDAPIAAPGPDGPAPVADSDRVAYLRSHIAACRDAIADGLPLAGYFVWTLMDNFEWSWGYTRRFGLVAVDPHSGRRRPKASYYYYRDIVAGYEP